MNRKLQAVLDVAIGLTISSAVVATLVFGTSILDNIHNGFLRILSHSVVKLTNAAGNSGATGFVVKGASGKKYIMTNAHVCGLAENGILQATYQGEQFPVEVYKKYQWNDLCALTAHRPLGFAVNIASSRSYGESAWVIGHPLLEPISSTVGELSGSVSIEIMTKLNPKPEECSGPTYSLVDLSNVPEALFFGVMSVCVRTLEANAGTISILPGNSGSPTVNLFGSVIGVAFAGSDSGVRSYFVPLNDLKTFLREL